MTKKDNENGRTIKRNPGRISADLRKTAADLRKTAAHLGQSPTGTPPPPRWRVPPRPAPPGSGAVGGRYFAGERELLRKFRQGFDSPSVAPVAVDTPAACCPESSNKAGCKCRSRALLRSSMGRGFGSRSAAARQGECAWLGPRQLAGCLLPRRKPGCTGYCRRTLLRPIILDLNPVARAFCCSNIFV